MTSISACFCAVAKQFLPRLRSLPYMYVLQAPCLAPCRHVDTFLAALQLLSPAEKVLQSLLGLFALDRLELSQSSNQDMVKIQPSSQLCSILNKIHSVQSWSKLTKDDDFKIRWSCRCEGLDCHRNYFNVSNAPHKST